MNAHIHSCPVCAGATRPPRFSHAIGLALAALALALPLMADAGEALTAWRNDAAHARTLAERDLPLADAEARRLEAALQPDATAGDRAKLHNLRARIELYMARIDNATEHARTALEFATRQADHAGRAEAHLNLAIASIMNGNIDELMAESKRALEALDGVDRPDLVGEAILQTSMAYRRIGQFESSVTIGMQAMEIARRSGDPLTLAYAHYGLAVTFDQSHRRVEAGDHFGQSLKYARETGYRLLEGRALIGLGHVSTALGEPERGEALIREAIAIFREAGAPSSIGLGLFALAHNFSVQGRHRDASPLLDEVVTAHREHASPIGLWYALNARSTNREALGDIGASLHDARAAYAIAENLANPAYQSESAQRVAQVVAASGDLDGAFSFVIEALARKAQAERERTNARMLELTQRYEEETQRREIAELTRTSERQTTELRQRELQQRWTWAVLLGTLIALTVVAFLQLRLRQSHGLLGAAYAELKRSEDHVRSLNTVLEQRVYAQTAELRQQTRYLRTLIDALPWEVWLKDTDGRYLAVNRSVADGWGLDADGLIGKSELEVRPSSATGSNLDQDHEVIASRRSKTVEQRHNRPDGSTRWTETFRTPVIDEDGTVLGTVGFAHDISERKATEVARESALAEAQRLARLRSEFIAQMSHELRTPLNGILGYAQILQLDASLGASQLAGVNVIRQSGEHLLALINGILDLAKFEAGKLELSATDFRLDDLLRAVTEIVRVKAERKLLEFICDVAPALPSWMHADEKRLRQVLLNLLANAVEFTAHGRIELRVRGTPAGRLRFEIEDTGIGIDPARLEAIFRPFEQAGDPRERAGGAGLGLAISQQFVRLMGGEISVDSRPGQGSLFAFEIDPATPVVVREPRQAGPSVKGYLGPRRRILVVDDIAANRTLLGAMFAPLGFEIVEAGDAAAAVEQASRHPPSLVLMDIVMPEVDGLEAARRLRALPGMGDVPIVAISASVLDGDQARCLDAGMNAFVAKPVELDRLLSLVASLLDLEWIRDEQEQVDVRQQEKEAPLVVPPKGEMQRLHHFALQGSMRDIAREAERLASLDESYTAFAEQLRRLAEDYQSQAVLRLVERHLDGALA